MSLATSAADLSPALVGLRETLVRALGRENVASDAATRRLFSQDVYCAAAEPVGLVIRPRTIEALQAAVESTAAAGGALVPRGGGMSYTAGYVVDRPDAVAVDMTGLDRIVEINTTDMYVTLEAGCTWAALREALLPHGLRTPFWGPLSGLRATVGGSLSQNSTFFGSGQAGPSADSVVALKVVLADGSLLPTGSGATLTGSGPAAPFFRQYGPDLTGLFLGDCGALGLKAEVTLRLVPLPEETAFLSFACESQAALVDLMGALSRAGLPAECFGFDPVLQAQRLKRASLSDDVRTLGSVIASTGNLLAGIGEAARVATAGRGYMKDVAYSAHVTLEAGSRAGVEAMLERARGLAAPHGREIENSIPKIMRSVPFGPVNSMLGPAGERWVPVHGVVPWSAAAACWQAIADLFDSRQDDLSQHGIDCGTLVASIATNGFLIEPVFYWPESWNDLHREACEESYLNRLSEPAPNPHASALVAALRAALCDLFLRFGAVHFQIGRTYPYAESRDPATLALLKAIKAALDPKGVMNPGALGL